MARLTGAYCYACRKSMRDTLAHQATAQHRKATRPTLSTGPKGSHAYRPPMMHAPELYQHGAAEDRRYDALGLAPDVEGELLAVDPEDPSSGELPLLDLVAPRHASPAVRGYRPGPCGPCGKSFRTDAGLAWHVINNRGCTRWRTA